MDDSSGRFSTRRIIDICVLLAFAALIAAYLFQVWSVSDHLLNTILVLPVSMLALCLCALELFRQIKSGDYETPKHEPVRTVLPVMILFSCYVLSLPWLGFDVGTAVFIMAFLVLHGEKRWYWAVAYGLTLGFLAAFAFSTLLPYPMPMLVLPTEY